MRQKYTIIAGLAALLCSGASAQDLKISGLLQVWQTQMMDSALRNGKANAYYNLRSEFTENGTSIRRAEIKFAGKVMDGVEFEAMVDPSASSGSILQDLALKYKPTKELEIKVGQFKNLQTMEANISSSELLFAERSMLARTYGDFRDRGIVASYQISDPKEFGAKLSLGVFNGISKANDTNAQKDYVARLDMNLGKEHKFGIYTLQGTTDVADKSGVLIAATPKNAFYPTQAAVYDNKDKTSNLGVFYSLRTGGFILDAEVMTGLVGRRAATLAPNDGNTIKAAWKREHLDQKFLGYYLTAGYTFGSHTLLARYDVMNYNSGDDYYGATSPYKGLEPNYKETTLGYTYAFNPEKLKAANLKVNYIHRSSNCLSFQGEEKSAGTLLVGFQIAF